MILNNGRVYITWSVIMRYFPVDPDDRCVCSFFIVLQVFDELLLDADWSVNAGTWLWLSCSSFFQQFLNCYCPVGFGKQADPTGDFIRYGHLNKLKSIFHKALNLF